MPRAVAKEIFGHASSSNDDDQPRPKIPGRARPRSCLTISEPKTLSSKSVVYSSHGTKIAISMKPPYLKDTTTYYVSNLPKEITTGQLLQYIKSDIKGLSNKANIDIGLNSLNNKPKFGFLRFKGVEKPEELCKKLNEISLDGHKLEVTLMAEKETAGFQKGCSLVEYDKSKPSSSLSYANIIKIHGIKPKLNSPLMFATEGDEANSSSHAEEEISMENEKKLETIGKRLVEIQEKRLAKIKFTQKVKELENLLKDLKDSECPTEEDDEEIAELEALLKKLKEENGQVDEGTSND